MFEQEWQRCSPWLQDALDHAGNLFSLDDVRKAFLVGMSFCIQPHVAFYVPLPHDFSECQSVLSEFMPIFHDTSKVLVAQNFKFDLKFLKKHGLHVRNRVFDTMVAHYLRVS